MTLPHSVFGVVLNAAISIDTVLVRKPPLNLFNISYIYLNKKNELL